MTLAWVSRATARRATPSPPLYNSPPQPPGQVLVTALHKSQKQAPWSLEDLKLQIVPTAACARSFQGDPGGPSHGVRAPSVRCPVDAQATVTRQAGQQQDSLKSATRAEGDSSRTLPCELKGPPRGLVSGAWSLRGWKPRRDPQAPGGRALEPRASERSRSRHHRPHAPQQRPPLRCTALGDSFKHF